MKTLVKGGFSKTSDLCLGNVSWESQSWRGACSGRRSVLEESVLGESILGDLSWGSHTEC